MNKYQKAYSNYMSDLIMLIGSADEPVKTSRADREALEELIDKEKPKKPTKDTDDNVRWKYYCPSCGERLNNLEKQRRCQGISYYVPRYDEYGCGQKIDWTD